MVLLHQMGAQILRDHLSDDRMGVELELCLLPFDIIKQLDECEVCFLISCLYELFPQLYRFEFIRREFLPPGGDIVGIGTAESGCGSP